MDKKSGGTGNSAIWDGPLSMEGRATSPGSSSGLKGMQVSKYPCSYTAGPITQIAKGK
jgi:hypothetical protein